MPSTGSFEHERGVATPPPRRSNRLRGAAARVEVGFGPTSRRGGAGGGRFRTDFEARRRGFRAVRQRGEARRRGWRSVRPAADRARTPDPCDVGPRSLHFVQRSSRNGTARSWPMSLVPGGRRRTPRRRARWPVPMAGSSGDGARPISASVTAASHAASNRSWRAPSMGTSGAPERKGRWEAASAPPPRRRRTPRPMSAPGLDACREPMTSRRRMRGSSRRTRTR
jgi:hypothetical protein